MLYKICVAFSIVHFHGSTQVPTRKLDYGVIAFKPKYT